MDLPSNLVKQFTEATKDTTPTNSETEAYGVVTSGGVILDGSTLVTPCKTTVSVNNGDRVIVSIKKHQAVITGNMTSPSLDEAAVEAAVEDIVDELGEEFQTKIDKTNEAITLKASQTSLNALGDRVTVAESVITQTAREITSKVSIGDFNSFVSQTYDAFSAKVSNCEFESYMEITADQISTKVSAGDICSTINQTAQGVKINASNIDLTGYVTINGGFHIKEDGSAEMVNAKAKNLDLQGKAKILGDVKFYNGLHTSYNGNKYLRGTIYLGDYPTNNYDPYGEMDGTKPCAVIHHNSNADQLIIRPNNQGDDMGITDDVRLGSNSNPFSHVRAEHFDTVSDRKQKNHLSYCDEDDSIARDLIYGLRPSMYTMKADKRLAPVHFGFYAQDVYEVLPKDGQNYSVVSAERKGDNEGAELTRKDTDTISDSNLSWTLSYNEIIAPLVAVVQSQKREIDALQKRLDVIEGKV